jgi:Anti-sigma-K factor rskA/Putative zinc-finger
MEAGIHELTAGYALDALDPEERVAFEEHLAGCERCQEELATLWEVTGALAVATTGPAPSAGLRDRILAEARAELQHVVPFEPRRRRLAPALAAVSAIAAAVAVGLGIYSLSLNGKLDDTRTALAQQQGAATVLADPTTRTVTLRSGSGRVVVAGNGDAVLVLDDAKPLPSGKTYEAWVIGAGQEPQPAGTFAEHEGRAVVKIGMPVTAHSIVGVTVENSGGATVPTLPMVAASSPA